MGLPVNSTKVLVYTLNGFARRWQASRWPSM